MARGFLALVVACSIAAAAAAPAKHNEIFAGMSPDGILLERHSSEMPKFLQAKVPAQKVTLGNTAHEAFTKNPFITVNGETVEMQIEAAVGGRQGPPSSGPPSSGPPSSGPPSSGPPEGGRPELPECHKDCIDADPKADTCNLDTCVSCNNACGGSDDFLMQMGDEKACHEACFSNGDCDGCGELSCHRDCADDSDGPEEMPECHKDCVMQDEEPQKCSPESCGHCNDACTGSHDFLLQVGGDLGDLSCHQQCFDGEDCNGCGALECHTSCMDEHDGPEGRPAGSGEIHYDGYGGGSGSGMWLPECGPCIEKFDQNNGCSVWASGDDPMSAVPDECVNHLHCAEEALMHCTDEIPCGMCVADFADAGGCKTWIEGGDPTDLIPPMCYHCGEVAAVHCFDSQGGHGPDGSSTKDCIQCAEEFSQNGGCQVWKAGLDPKEYIPSGCDETCKEEAETECAMEQNEVVKTNVKQIKQVLTLDGVSPEDLTDETLQAYAIAMAIELGLYDEETKSVKQGSSVTAVIVTSEVRAASLLQEADATVPESQLLTDGGAAVEFTTSTDDVSVSGGSVSADGFANAVEQANTELGTSAPSVDASSISVSEATESTAAAKTEESGASSTVPTLLAGCLVLATALFTKA